MKRKNIMTALIVALLGCVVGSSAFVCAESAPSRADVFVPIEGVASVQENYNAPDYLSSVNGVFIQTNSTVAKVRYRGVIDANKLNGDTFLSFYALGSQSDAVISQVDITLTDTENTENRIGLRYYPVGLNENCTYILAYSNGRYRGEEGGTVYENAFGTVSYGPNFYPEASKSVVAFDSRFDYKERIFTNYSIFGGEKIILDLDKPSHVGENGKWNGFDKDACYLDISIKLTSSSPGGIVITNLLGEDMSGTLGSNVPIPAITVDYDGDLPNGAINVGYPIPSARAFDWYCGVQEVDVSLRLGEKDVTDLIKNGVFVPEQIGVYKLEYSIENSLGGKDKAEKTFRVGNKLPQYTFYFEGGLRSPLLGNVFTVPVVSVAGGTGRLTVSEEIRYNGEKLNLSEQRRILANRPGMIELKYVVSGYCGDSVTRIFGVPVENPRARLLLSGEPQFIKKGVPLILPQCTAVGEEAENARLSVFADGTEIMGDSVVTDKAAGEIVAIEWKLVKRGEVIALRTLNVEVAELDSADGYFLVTKGNPALQAVEAGVDVRAEKDFSFRTLYPVALDDAGVVFRFRGIISHIDIQLQDESYPELKGFLRIYSESGKLYVKANGKGKAYPIEGDFEGGQNVGFILDRFGNVLNMRGEKIFEAKFTESGGIHLSFSVCGVSAPVTFTLVQIGNQRLSGSQQAPGLVLDEPMELFRYLSIGKKFSVCGAVAYDVFDYGGRVRLTVTAPDSTQLYSGEPISTSFTALQYGVYVITYEVSDASGNTVKRNYLVNVLDEQAPLLEVANFPERVQVGKKTALPKPYIKDNVSGDCFGYIVIRNRKTYVQQTLYSEYYSEWSGVEHTFFERGAYDVIYVASDEAGNTAVCTLRLEVK